MASLSILRALGIGFLAVALGEWIIAAACWAFDLGPADPFAFAAIATSLLGGAMSLSANGERIKSDLREALLFALLWWTLTPFVASLPFVLGGMALFDAYFESVASLTTTGAWLSNQAAISSPPDMLWRALLQWGGGLVSLSIAAAVFVQPIFVGIETLPPKFTRREGATYFQSIWKALRYIGPIYASLSIVVFLLLVVSGAAPVPSAATALSVVASGGFFPVIAGSGELAPVVSGILLPFVLISGASFAALALNTHTWRARAGENETGAFFVVVGAVAALLILFSGEFSVSSFGRHAFNAASLMSTNGVVLGAPENLPIALVAVVIGGSAISTAGGLKILRWLVIFKRVREEVRRLITPRAVFGKAVVEHELGVWMHFIIFTFVLAGLILMLTAGGHSFELAACAAAGVLSNAGPVLQLASESPEGYAVFENPALRIALAGGMILGRIEAVVALALINRGFWRS